VEPIEKLTARLESREPRRFRTWRVLGALAALAGVLVLALLWRELHRQNTELARIRKLAEAQPREERPGSTSNVYYLVNGKQGEESPAKTEPPAPEPAPPPEDDEERTEEQERQADEARIGRMFGEFEQQPVDDKAGGVRRQLQGAFDEALAKLPDLGVKYSALECRARWCSMNIEYSTSSKLGDFDEALRGVLFSFEGGLNPPAVSRLTKQIAGGTGREGRYFFRWKPEYW
jgi:hypothetical protein